MLFPDNCDEIVVLVKGILIIIAMIDYNEPCLQATLDVHS